MSTRRKTRSNLPGGIRSPGECAERIMPAFVDLRIARQYVESPETIKIHSCMPEKTLLALIRHRPAIRFDNLTSITPATARALARRRLNHLCEGLEGDFEEACQAVADDDPHLSLDRLSHLSATCARELAKHPWPLSLKVLIEIDANVARALSRRNDPVYFDDAIRR